MIDLLDSSELNRLDIAILFSMLMRCEKNGVLNISMFQFSEEFSCSYSTFGKAMKRLRKQGFLKMKYMLDHHGKTHEVGDWKTAERFRKKGWSVKSTKHILNIITPP